MMQPSVQIEVEEAPGLYLLKQDMKVDVVLLTLNSMKCLKECVESVYRNLYVNRLIVVDGGSTDGTVEYLSKVPNVEIYYDLEGTRATARELGIKKVETEWFFFIDSDVVLNDGWFSKEVYELMNNPEVGAIQGADAPVWDQQQVYDIREAMLVLRKRFGMKEKSSMIDRGFTGDVLIRTDAVKNIKIPRYLHIYEDNYIKRWIEKNGYKWIVTENSTCKHYVNYYQKLDRVYDAIVSYKTGFLNSKNVSKALVTVVPKAVFVSVYKTKPGLFSFLVAEQVHTAAGFLKARISYG